MKIVATIEARMRSTRLPGKVLKPVLGRPLLELMVGRVRRAKRIDEIVIATTDDASCDPIEDLARQIGVSFFRGSEDDVLGRVLGAAQSAQADLIVELTGDCPLLDPGLIDRVIETYLAGDVDYCSNRMLRTHPIGMDIQVFPTAVLEQVAGLTSDPRDREHVSIYIYEHPERFRLLNFAESLPPSAPDLRLTLDTPLDYELIQTVFERLYPRNPHFGLPEMLELFAQEPALAAVNEASKPKPRQ